MKPIKVFATPKQALAYTIKKAKKLLKKEGDVVLVMDDWYSCILGLTLDPMNRYDINEVKGCVDINGDAIKFDNSMYLDKFILEHFLGIKNYDEDGMISNSEFCPFSLKCYKKHDRKIVKLFTIAIADDDCKILLSQWIAKAEIVLEKL